MSRLNIINNKLQAQRNFPSIWHSEPQWILRLLKEDEILRYYIQGTMKARSWRVSEIIIKRKVFSLHIAFQAQFPKQKQRKKWKKKTKNRLKNRWKYFEKLRKIKELRKKMKKSGEKSLSKSLLKLTRILRQFNPNTNISFYVQRVTPLHLNTQLIQQWITSQVAQKKSHKRLIYRVIKYYISNVEKRIQVKAFRIKTIWGHLKTHERQDLVDWLSINCNYLSHLFVLKHGPHKQFQPFKSLKRVWNGKSEIPTWDDEKLEDIGRDYLSQRTFPPIKKNKWWKRIQIRLSPSDRWDLHIDPFYWEGTPYWKRMMKKKYSYPSKRILKKKKIVKPLRRRG